MPEINLDDVHDELLDNDDPSSLAVDVPTDLENEPDEEDLVNLFDLSPDIYGDAYREANPTDGSTPITDQDPESLDVITDLLKAKGIEDPTAIEYEGEDGELATVSFYDLSYNDQLEILTSEDEANGGLQDHELDTISFLRENGVTFEEAVEYFQRKAIEDHLNAENISGLEVDQYADEELFAMDLKSKYPELSDEELEIELTKQLEHPELFRKKVEQLRTDYKEIEATQLDQARLEQEQLDESRRQELEDTLVQTAITVEELGGLTLDDNDKNEVLSFILEKDMNGYSAFIKSLNSPQNLFEAAWFVTKGKEAFNILHDYYKKEISQVSKSSYERGRQAANGTTPKPEPTSRKSFTRKATAPVSNQPTGSTPLSIDDLTIE